MVERARRLFAEKIAALSEKRGRYQAMLAQLERTGENQISLTDPDSRAMAAHTKVAVGYNIQVAVDAKNRLIVELQRLEQRQGSRPPHGQRALRRGHLTSAGRPTG